MIDTYAQYSGHELIKMGKKLFCDLSPPNYACDIIWEHLMMLRQGKPSMIHTYTTIIYLLLLITYLHLSPYTQTQPNQPKNKTKKKKKKKKH